MSYLPCELHCHSVHSDGSFSVAELLRRAYDDHLALIALTDHNTVSGHGELDDSITPAVPGIEWTTFLATCWCWAPGTLWIGGTQCLPI